MVKLIQNFSNIFGSNRAIDVQHSTLIAAKVSLCLYEIHPCCWLQWRVAGDSLQVERTQHVMSRPSTCIALDMPVTSPSVRPSVHPSIHPVRWLNDCSLINISLHNLNQELIKPLIFYYSSTWATPPPVAVPSLGVWVYCCFSGWCLNWLPDLFGLLGFWVASAARGRGTARHRNTIYTNWLADFVL